MTCGIHYNMHGAFLIRCDGPGFSGSPSQVMGLGSLVPSDGPGFSGSPSQVMGLGSLVPHHQ